MVCEEQLASIGLRNSVVKTQFHKNTTDVVLALLSIPSVPLKKLMYYKTRSLSQSMLISFLLISLQSPQHCYQEFFNSLILKAYDVFVPAVVQLLKRRFDSCNENFTLKWNFAYVKCFTIIQCAHVVQNRRSVLSLAWHECCGLALWSEPQKGANTTLTEARTSSENATSRFCNHFSIIHSHYA